MNTSTPMLNGMSLTRSHYRLEEVEIKEYRRSEVQENTFLSTIKRFKKNLIAISLYEIKLGSPS